jgi:hypothetical protein
MALLPVNEHRALSELNTESIPAGDQPGVDPIMAATTAMPAMLAAGPPLDTTATANIFHPLTPFSHCSFTFSPDSFAPPSSVSLHDALSKHLLPSLSTGSLTSSYSQHVFNMAGDVKHRVRNLSRSSTEREPSSEPKHNRKSNSIDLTETKPTARSSPNPKKRPSDEPIDYPRRRATIAVRNSLSFV